MNHNSVKCNMIPFSICAFKFARANLNSNKRFKTPDSCWDEMETSHTRPAHALASTIFGRSAHALSDGLLGKYDGMEQRECFQHCMLQQWNNASSIKHLLCCPQSVGSLEATLDKLGIPNNLASCTWVCRVYQCNPTVQTIATQFLNSKKQEPDRGRQVLYHGFLQWVGVGAGFMEVLCMKCILETAALCQGVVSLSFLFWRSMDHPSAHHLQWRTTGVENWIQGVKPDFSSFKYFVNTQLYIYNIYI